MGSTGSQRIGYESPILQEYRYFGAIVAGEESSLPIQIECEEVGEFD